MDRSNLTTIPYYGTSLNTAALRDLYSAPEPYIGNQSFGVRAAQVAGGGSQVNGMAWNYGSIGDYDGWEALGNPGWGWDAISSYIKKVRRLGAMPSAFLSQCSPKTPGCPIHSAQFEYRGLVRLLVQYLRVC